MGEFAARLLGMTAKLGLRELALRTRQKPWQFYAVKKWKIATTNKTVFC
jgi:hypothetical protein